MSVTWQRINAVLLVVVLFTLGAVIAILATRAEGGPLDPPAAPVSTDGVRAPGTPIAGPTTISSPGRYDVTRDITVSGGASGIFISSDDVDLDLGGFTISGGGTGSGGFGIYLSGAQRNNIGIHHGTLRNFQFGLAAASGHEVHIDQVRAYANARGMEIGSYTTLTNCVSDENTETGLRVAGFDNLIQFCEIDENQANGISIEGGYNRVTLSTVVRNNFASSADWGGMSIAGQYNTIDRATVGGLVAAITFPSLASGGGNFVLDTACTGGAIVSHNGYTQYWHETDHGNPGC